MTREQEYNAASAKAAATAYCAAAIRMTSALLIGARVPAGVKDAQAYRDEVKRIGDFLTMDAEDADDAAEILRPV